jgi:hypothetical protein
LPGDAAANKERITRFEAVAEARKKGNLSVKLMISSPGNVEDFWEEYTGLCELEKQGKTWRQWKGGRAAWAWRKFVAEEIMADIAMETAAGNDETAATKLALERMQGRLTKYKDDKMADISARVNGGAKGQGKPVGTQWSALCRELRQKKPKAPPYGGKCGACMKRKNKCVCPGGASKSIAENRCESRRSTWLGSGI